MTETTIDRITTLIVDDHSMVRQGICAFLEDCDDIEIVGEAASGEQAVQLCQDFAPDVVLMDLVMPGMDGIEAIRLIKSISPRTNILVLTSYHDNDHILPAIRAGAQSYLLKDVTPEDLAQAIRKAYKGEVVLHPNVAAQVVRILNGNNGQQIEAASELTAREIEVLHLVADGLNNAEIGLKLFISEKTAKSHVSNILSKLHLADRTQAAVYAWREGMKQQGK